MLEVNNIIYHFFNLWEGFRMKKVNKMRIDLKGPDGNAYALLAIAGRLGRKLNLEPGVREMIHWDMTRSDYNHMVDVFDREFSDQVTLINKPK